MTSPKLKDWPQGYSKKPAFIEDVHGPLGYTALFHPQVQESLFGGAS